MICGISFLFFSQIFYFIVQLTLNCCNCYDKGFYFLFFLFWVILQDGRKIQIGDCALFQAGNAPPFIGLIRWLNTGCGEHLKLGVNWLYRPADIKLSKGAQLEAAPNEVFYSFHRDEIPAASLLHPCKVAFLRKGVELPTGISSFVCRRVYDIANKCLWWLTDQDYINVSQTLFHELLSKSIIARLFFDPYCLLSLIFA